MLTLLGYSSPLLSPVGAASSSTAYLEEGIIPSILDLTLRKGALQRSG